MSMTSLSMPPQYPQYQQQVSQSQYPMGGSPSPQNFDSSSMSSLQGQNSQSSPYQSSSPYSSQSSSFSPASSQTSLSSQGSYGNIGMSSGGQSPSQSGQSFFGQPSPQSQGGFPYGFNASLAGGMPQSQGGMMGGMPGMQQPQFGHKDKKAQFGCAEDEKPKFGHEKEHKASFAGKPAPTHKKEKKSLDHTA